MKGGRESGADNQDEYRLIGSFDLYEGHLIPGQMGEKGDCQDEVMTEVEVSSTLVDFAASGRTGRRNAVPDIQGDPNAEVGSSDITFDMEKLKCSDSSQPQASTSGASPQPSTSSSTEGATAS